MNKQLGRQIYVSIVVAGLFLPSVIGIIVVLVIEPAELAKLFVASARSLILIGLFNAIPFVVFSKLLRGWWSRTERSEAEPSVVLKHKYGLVFAAIAGLSSILYVHINTWISIVKVLPGSSTAPISFILAPIYGIIAIGLGYGLGMFIAKIQEIIMKSKGQI